MRIPPCFSTPEASRNLTLFSQTTAAKRTAGSRMLGKIKEYLLAFPPLDGVTYIYDRNVWAALEPHNERWIGDLPLRLGRACITHALPPRPLRRPWSRHASARE